jgi:hypothetical protein
MTEAISTDRARTVALVGESTVLICSRMTKGDIVIDKIGSREARTAARFPFVSCLSHWRGTRA